VERGEKRMIGRWTQIGQELRKGKKNYGKEVRK